MGKKNLHMRLHFQIKQKFLIFQFLQFTEGYFFLTCPTPNKSDKDPTLVTSDLENNTTVLALPFIGTQETPTIKI